MTTATPRGPIVIDTDVYGTALTGSELAVRYRPLVAGRPVFISFQTAAELRFGAILRGWGAARMLKLDARIASAEIVHTGPELVESDAKLRAHCWQIGHALGQKEHDADRWVAATAIRLGLPLVANDGIYRDVPGLRVERSPND